MSFRINSCVYHDFDMELSLHFQRNMNCTLLLSESDSSPSKPVLKKANAVDLAENEGILQRGKTCVQFISYKC